MILQRLAVLPTKKHTLYCTSFSIAGHTPTYTAIRLAGRTPRMTAFSVAGRTARMTAISVAGTSGYIVFKRTMSYGRPVPPWYQAGAWIGLVVLIAVCGCILVWFWRKKKERNMRLSIKTVGKSRIGGTWTLVDHTGAVQSNASFSGNYLLMYFGFTFCPDICPVELKKMSYIINTLDKDLGTNLITPLFVSLDPWRDSIEQLSVYVKQFNPRFVGLTGTPQQCEELAKKFRVYSTNNRKVDREDDDYVVDHSIWLYLMDKEGKFISIFGVDKDGEDVVEEIREILILRQDMKEPLWRKLRNFFRVD